MKIAIMGYGTIGSGVAEVLEVNQELLAERAGEALEIKYMTSLKGGSTSLSLQFLYPKGDRYERNYSKPK